MEDISSDENSFENNFNLGSFIPLFIFILGIYIMFLILKTDYGLAFFLMIISFLIFIYNNIRNNINQTSSIFNEFLEDLSSFLTFGVNLVIFGIIFYKGNLSIMLVIFFFGICSVLSMSRNWILNQKNSVGFPLVLNGLFFPLIYYVYIFYLQESGSSLFIFYYFVIGILAVSKNNYIEFEDIIEIKIKNRSSNTNHFEKDLENISAKTLVSVSESNKQEKKREEVEEEFDIFIEEDEKLNDKSQEEILNVEDINKEEIKNDDTFDFEKEDEKVLKDVLKKKERRGLISLIFGKKKDRKSVV